MKKKFILLKIIFILSLAIYNQNKGLIENNINNNNSSSMNNYYYGIPLLLIIISISYILYKNIYSKKKPSNEKEEIQKELAILNTIPEGYELKEPLKFYEEECKKKTLEEKQKQVAKIKESEINSKKKRLLDIENRKTNKKNEEVVPKKQSISDFIKNARKKIQQKEEEKRQSKAGQELKARKLQEKNRLVLKAKKKDSSIKYIGALMKISPTKYIRIYIEKSMINIYIDFFITMKPNYENLQDSQFHPNLIYYKKSSESPHLALEDNNQQIDTETLINSSYDENNSWDDENSSLYSESKTKSILSESRKKENKLIKIKINYLIGDIKKLENQIKNLFLEITEIDSTVNCKTSNINNMIAPLESNNQLLKYHKLNKNKNNEDIITKLEKEINDNIRKKNNLIEEIGKLKKKKEEKHTTMKLHENQIKENTTKIKKLQNSLNRPLIKQWKIN